MLKMSLPNDRKSLLLLVVLVIGIGGILLATNRYLDTKLENVQEKKRTCIPTFIDGGGPYYLPNAPFRTVIHPEQTNGDLLVVSGKLLRNDCQTPIIDGVIDLWQADEEGNYVPEWYRGKIRSGSDGTFAFSTVIPKGYGEGTNFRPPHIHFKVFENSTELVTSQMFFPDVQGRFEDAYIMKIEEDTAEGKKIFRASHDIIIP